MNPCRCGFFGHPTRKCTCGKGEVQRYISKISGPLLDRIDIQIELPSLSYAEISARSENTETSAQIRERVIAAREFMQKRLEAEGLSGLGIFSNAQLDASGIRKTCHPTDQAVEVMRMAYDRLGLSARGYDRVMRMARTIADLAASERIEANHIAEAITLRSLDKKYWG
jgi:magnesium chelatase family protein